MQWVLLAVVGASFFDTGYDLALQRFAMLPDKRQSVRMNAQGIAGGHPRKGLPIDRQMGCQLIERCNAVRQQGLPVGFREAIGRRDGRGNIEILGRVVH